MKGRIWTGLMLCAIVSMLMFSFACAKKSTTMPSTASQGMSQEDLDRQAREQAERDAAMSEQGLAAQRAEAARLAREQLTSEDIFFEFDSALLTPQATEILTAKGQWLRDNPGNVTIEGHTDERGTSEYNLALGDRRALSAKNFLVDLGISSGRIRTVSYGEENPVDPGQSEDAFAKNRRAHFVITD